MCANCSMSANLPRRDRISTMQCRSTLLCPLVPLLARLSRW